MSLLKRTRRRTGGSGDGKTCGNSPVTAPEVLHRTITLRKRDATSLTPQPRARRTFTNVIQQTSTILSPSSTCTIASENPEVRAAILRNDVSHIPFLRRKKGMGKTITPIKTSASPPVEEVHAGPTQQSPAYSPASLRRGFDQKSCASFLKAGALAEAIDDIRFASGKIIEIVNSTLREINSNKDEMELDLSSTAALQLLLRVEPWFKALSEITIKPTALHLLAHDFERLQKMISVCYPLLQFFFGESAKFSLTPNSRKLRSLLNSVCLISSACGVSLMMALLRTYEATGNGEYLLNTSVVNAPSGTPGGPTKVSEDVAGIIPITIKLMIFSITATINFYGRNEFDTRSELRGIAEDNLFMSYEMSFPVKILAKLCSLALIIDPFRDASSSTAGSKRGNTDGLSATAPRSILSSTIAAEGSALFVAAASDVHQLMFNAARFGEFKTLPLSFVGEFYWSWLQFLHSFSQFGQFLLLALNSGHELDDARDDPRVGSSAHSTNVSTENPNNNGSVAAILELCLELIHLSKCGFTAPSDRNGKSYWHDDESTDNPAPVIDMNPLNLSSHIERLKVGPSDLFTEMALSSLSLTHYFLTHCTFDGPLQTDNYWKEFFIKTASVLGGFLAADVSNNVRVRILACQCLAAILWHTSNYDTFVKSTSENSPSRRLRGTSNSRPLVLHFPRVEKAGAGPDAGPDAIHDVRIKARIPNWCRAGLLDRFDLFLEGEDLLILEYLSFLAAKTAALYSATSDSLTDQIHELFVSPNNVTIDGGTVASAVPAAVAPAVPAAVAPAVPAAVAPAVPAAVAPAVPAAVALAVPAAVAPVVPAAVAPVVPAAVAPAAPAVYHDLRHGSTNHTKLLPTCVMNQHLVLANMALAIAHLVTDRKDLFAKSVVPYFARASDECAKTDCGGDAEVQWAVRNLLDPLKLYVAFQKDAQLLTWAELKQLYRAVKTYESFL